MVQGNSLLKRAMKRYKIYIGFLFLWLFSSILVTVVSGSYTWDGKTYKHRLHKKFDDGFYEVYSNEDEVCTSGIIIPGTELLPAWLLGIVYFCGMGYLFMGIAIIAEIFMGAIEVITSQTRKIKYKDENDEVQYFEVTVWNATVANITLMALGTSAPEILFNIIETILTLGKEPDKLGPSAIVGSASYNFLMISAFSIISVPTGTIKKINAFPVYILTSIISIFAYIWMYIVLAVWTKDMVTYAEAFITLGMFVVLILCAYFADKWSEKVRLKAQEALEEEQDKHETDAKYNLKNFYNLFKSTKSERKRIENKKDKVGENHNQDSSGDNESIDMHDAFDSHNEQSRQSKQNSELGAYFGDTLQIHGIKSIAPEDLKKAAILKSELDTVRYRSIVGRNLSGHSPFLSRKQNHKKGDAHNKKGIKTTLGLNSLVGFKCMRYTINESEEQVKIEIIKKVVKAMKVGFRTIDDTAVTPDDYSSLETIIEFEEGENLTEDVFVKTSKTRPRN